jgi:hypothetical protein
MSPIEYISSIRDYSAMSLTRDIELGHGLYRPAEVGEAKGARLLRAEFAPRTGRAAANGGWTTTLPYANPKTPSAGKDRR